MGEILENSKITEEKQQSRSILFSNGIIQGIVIAGIPVIGYLMAFCYELGYVSHFKITNEVIDISLFAIFLRTFEFLFFIIAVSLGGSFLTIIINKFIPVKYITFKNSLVILLIIYLIFVILILYISLKGIYLHQYVNLIMFWAVINYSLCIPIYFFKKESIYNNRVIKIISIIFLSSFLLLTYYNLGFYSAVTQSEFLILANTQKEQEKAVIRFYSDHIILVPFDRKNQTFSDQFYISIVGDQNISFKYESIGPLTLTETQDN